VGQFTAKHDEQAILSSARRIASGEPWRAVARDAGCSTSTLSRRIRTAVERLEAARGDIPDIGLPVEPARRLVAMHEREQTRARQARHRERVAAAQPPPVEPERPRVFTIPLPGDPDQALRFMDGSNADMRYAKSVDPERRARRAALFGGLAAHLDRLDMRREAAEERARQNVRLSGNEDGLVRWAAPDGSESGAYDVHAESDCDYVESVMRRFPGFETWVAIRA
jgi:hypothetical protein